MTSSRGFDLFVAAITLALLSLSRWPKPASAAPLMSSIRQDLLLTTPVAVLPATELSKLDETVISNYTVKPNEDMWAVCRRFHTDAFSIRSSNDLDERLPAGTVLRIPNHRGTLFQVNSAQSLHDITGGFTLGKLKGTIYDREVLEANGYPMPDLHSKDYHFAPGTVLFLPNAWKPTGLPFPFASDGHRLRITSFFGMRKHPILGKVRHHSGYDIAKPYGTAVVASREGVVESAGWAGGYGNMIDIRHVIKSRSGVRVFVTRYGHLSKIYVHAGQHVHLYQLIGRVGSTGLSTGPHLHFEVRTADGQAIDPGRFQ
jgi:murein DD-endopeptidase MepM/ murein hydrolase activator NlpD